MTSHLNTNELSVSEDLLEHRDGHLCFPKLHCCIQSSSEQCTDNCKVCSIHSTVICSRRSDSAGSEG